MDESTATQGSTIKSKKSSTKEEYTTNRSTVRLNANFLSRAHCVDQRTRIEFRKQLLTIPFFNSLLATDVDVYIYEKSKNHSWMYRKRCVRLLSMLRYHDKNWIERIKQCRNIQVLNPLEIPSILFSMTNKEWLENSDGWKAFKELEERKTNFQKLLDSKGGLDTTDPGSVIRCFKCKSNRIEWIPVQNRGADEAQTIKAYCLNCQKHFNA